MGGLSSAISALFSRDHVRLGLLRAGEMHGRVWNRKVGIWAWFYSCWAGSTACSDLHSHCDGVCRLGSPLDNARACDVFSLVKGWLNEQFSVKTHCGNHTEEGLLDRKTLQGQVSKYCQGHGKRCCAVFSEEGLGSLGSPNPCEKDRELVRHIDFQANAQLQHWC